MALATTSQLRISVDIGFRFSTSQSWRVDFLVRDSEIPHGPNTRMSVENATSVFDIGFDAGSILACSFQGLLKRSGKIAKMI